jgi:hypothetical protein
MIESMGVHPPVQQGKFTPPPQAPPDPNRTNPIRVGIFLIVGILGCPPGPVTPLPPDASDASPPIGDADPYVACCAKMHDATPECPLTLAHIVQTHITSVPAACSTCGLGCR